MQQKCPKCGHKWSQASAAPKLRGLDPKVAGILREEARHEAAARQEAAAKIPFLHGKLSPLRLIEGDQRETKPAAAGGTAGAEGWAEAERRRRSGFLRGFVSAALLAAAGIAAYNHAPRAIEALPDLETYMTIYADWVNALRAKVDSGVNRSIERIQDALAQFR